MKATVYFIQLSDAQVAKINGPVGCGGGWGGAVGRTYWKAQNKGEYKNAALLGMIQPAAKLEAYDAENVFHMIQNHQTPWTASEHVEVLTDKPRSMMVGDVIVWEDGTTEVVARFGFEKYEGDFKKMLKEQSELGAYFFQTTLDKALEYVEKETA